MTDISAPSPSTGPSNRLKGFGYVVVASVLLGLLPTAGRLAFDAGADNTGIQTARFIGATVIMIPLFFKYWDNMKILMQRPWMMALLSVLVGMAAGGNIGAVQYIPVAIASLLFFTFPLWIALVEHITGRDRLSPVRFIAVLMGLAGVGAVLGLSEAELNPIGVGLSLMAAFAATIQLILIPRVSATAGTMPVVAFTTAAMMLVFCAIWAVKGASFPATSIGWSGIGLIAVSHVVGVFLLFRALLFLGPTRTGVTNNLEPMVSVVAAAVILGEFLGPIQALGGALILVAVILSQADSKPAA